jgi:hypothetical protein
VLAALVSRAEAAMRAATIAGERARTPLAKALAAEMLEAERRALADTRDAAKQAGLDVDGPVAHDAVLAAGLGARGDETARLSALPADAFDAAFLEASRADFAEVRRLADVGRRLDGAATLPPLYERLANEARAFERRAEGALPRACGGELAIPPEPGGAPSPSAPASDAAPSETGPGWPLAGGSPSATPDAGPAPPRPDAGAKRR